ncbi:MalY/PatB family protein [Furfurilactobacillus siliginis]|uniref:cysteine-S-conjugate beta-lyase n=1 Tax=Furfurilactobacillus siliginis TaxID=348151 RepID=A0A0R2KXD3_9LACO|nr:PatB family C-S lyase [Furfurilactobacillus siliginis]KRN94227.1 aminotransferase [Furfurilactobacillus siliginis]GEK29255.1 cystathionine beta-lyase [Furfurilactobacillus siliginis]
MSVTDFVNQYGVDRRHTNSLKWDALDERFGDATLTPLWVADMEFREPASVTDAIIERVRHGVFGYAIDDPAYFDAFNNWQQTRHNLSLERRWLTFDNGVVNSLYTIVNTFTKPDDAVMVLTPVYYPFKNAVTDNHRTLITSELKHDQDTFTIDFADVEAKIVANDVRVLIHCSPHNPIGRIWTPKELEQLLSICARHNVLVVSDEIHQDFEIGDCKFVSALTVADGRYNDHLIVLNAPSKSFNMATLLNSHVIIPNATLQTQFLAGQKCFNQVELSVLGQTAGEAAYRTAGDWFDELVAVIRSNYQYVRDELAVKAPAVHVANLEGTYLLWLDLRSVVDPTTIHEFVQNKVGLAVDYGEWFSDEDQGCIRLNLATKPEFVHAAVQQLLTALVH